MDAEARRALLGRAITTYGAPAQMDMAVEEMAELTKALCKIKRAQAGCEVTAAIGKRGRGDGRRPDHARPAPHHLPPLYRGGRGGEAGTAEKPS